MADDIALRYSNLKITAAEDEVVNFDHLSITNDDSPLDLSLVGKVMTVRPFNFEAFKNTMNQIWAISKHALFRPIENGLFVVQFASSRDKMRVLDGCPWTFDQHLVMLQKVEGGVQPSEIGLSHCPFWIRLYNLPLDSRTQRHVGAIGSSLGKVLEVESTGVLWDKSARLRVLLDVTKPLRRIQKIKNSEGKVVAVDIKYERLPIFCYACGHIGHMERDCSEVSEDDREEEKQWGSWLKASPRKGRLKLEEEAKKFLAAPKKLDFGDSQGRGQAEREASARGELAGRKVVMAPQSIHVNMEHAVHKSTLSPSTEAHAHVVPVEQFSQVSDSPNLTFSLGIHDGGIKHHSRGRVKKKIVSKVGVKNDKSQTPKLSSEFNEKRKLPEYMLTDDVVDEGEGVQKKLKMIEILENGSDLVTVEAVVGEIQPRPAL